MLNTIFFVLLGAVAGQAANLYQSKQVEALTNQLGENIQRYAVTGQGNVAMFYDDKSMLSFESSLPIGGLYEDMDDIALFYKRVGLSLKVDDFDFTLLGANEATGISILETKLKARLRSRNQPLALSLTNIIEWNQLTGKIKTHLIIDKHVARTLRTVATPAEKHLYNLYNEMMKTANSNLQGLRDGTAPVWDLISDNIQMKLNMFPDDIWGQNEWNGKQELIAHMEETKSKDLLLTRGLAEKIEGLKSTTLFADEDEVWKKFELPSEVIGDNDEHELYGVILIHYMFDAQGKLILEEITLSKALEPWQIYPLPDIYNKQSEQSTMGATNPHVPVSNVVNIGDVQEFTQVGHLGVGDISHYKSKVKLEFEGLTPEGYKSYKNYKNYKTSKTSKNLQRDMGSKRNFEMGTKEGQLDYNLMEGGNTGAGFDYQDTYSIQQQQRWKDLMDKAKEQVNRANLMEGEAQPAFNMQTQQQQDIMHKQMQMQRP